VLVHVVSQRARVLRLRRTGWPLALHATNRVAFPVTSGGRRPDPAVFRSSIAPPTDTSVYTSTDTSRCHPQDSRPGWIRCSFPVGLFHPLQHAGLSRRSTYNRVVGKVASRNGGKPV